MRGISTKGLIAGLLAVAVAAVCIRLGFWQLDRRTERIEANEVLSAAMAAPVLSLQGDTLAAVAADPSRFRFRRVRVTGNYAEEGTALLRGRAREGSPGVHLVSPLVIEGTSSVVLVDRGWLPAPDANTADPRPYQNPGRVTLPGMIRMLPRAGSDGSRPLVAPLGDDFGVPTYQRLDPASYREQFPQLLPFYIERLDDGAATGGLPFAAPMPRLDEGPHLGYAVQWFGFAAIALIGFGIAAARISRNG